MWAEINLLLPEGVKHKMAECQFAPLSIYVLWLFFSIHQINVFGEGKESWDTETRNKT